VERGEKSLIFTFLVKNKEGQKQVERKEESVTNKEGQKQNEKTIFGYDKACEK